MRVRRLLLRSGILVAVLIALILGLPPLFYAAFPEPVPELPPPGRRVELPTGAGVNVIERGAGPPIVLVHGHPGHAYQWTRLMDALAARGFRAIAYDRPGYGYSDPRPSGHSSVAASAADLLGLLEALDVRDAVVVGWSYGGATSITALRKDASRVARLVLVCSVGPGIEEREGPPRIVWALVGPALAWLQHVPPLHRRVAAAFTAAAFAPERAPQGAENQLLANLARPHTLRTLRSEGFDLDGTADLDPGPIARPILVIHGDGDLLSPLAVAEELHRRARDAELQVVPGGGHALPVTRSESVADRIAAFGTGS